MEETYTIDAVASESLIGKPVRWNFQGPPIGRVIDAKVEERGLHFTFVLESDYAKALSSTATLSLRPSRPAQELLRKAEDEAFLSGGRKAPARCQPTDAGV